MGRTSRTHAEASKFRSLLLQPQRQASTEKLLMPSESLSGTSFLSLLFGLQKQARTQNNSLKENHLIDLQESWAEGIFTLLKPQENQHLQSYTPSCAFLQFLEPQPRWQGILQRKANLVKHRLQIIVGRRGCKALLSPPGNVQTMLSGEVRLKTMHFLSTGFELLIF